MLDVSFRQSAPVLQSPIRSTGELAMRSLRLVAALAAAFLRRPEFALGLALLLPLLFAPGEPVATAAQPTAGGEKVSPEEASWRDRVGKARSRATELERAAEEAELRITTLRNDLGNSGQSSRYRNDTAAELDQAGRRLIDIRANAKVAADDLAELVEYGRQKGFAEAAAPQPTSGDGKPNEEYFRTRLDKLTGDIDSAQRRISLYENRVRDISQRIIMKGGKKGGENFYIAQLQQDRADAQAKLDEARDALTKAQADLDALKEEARRADVSRD